ncbi:MULTISPECIES: carbohydrate ABC transporter permease [unclassified Bacillus (in: firmicutes)]|uniref:carbohydrate ABC transporter permease n=1 Tax=unclassified Bacillus (in: firmicutes) TaxID=185979 RepID=UPI0008EC9965|nr:MULTISPECIES: carbohydrate ABC transporter permease [unclassified Bacillus (in: firmicutes)]SFB13407.1 raffinose/stachyose/melibiose transport system permease protein [Bacillus sp. UNCCL13]SFQ90022.1 raffinose/stachyose/melibiose transport system permease protein [Bacillus sp. cl95]
MGKKYRLPLEILGIVLALLWLSPFYLMIVNSFKTKKEMFTDVLSLPAVFTLDNYKEAFIELDFIKTFFNSLLITVISVAIIIVFSSMAAYALSRTKSKISTVLFFLFVAAMLIPFQSVMIPLVTIFGKMELLNRFGIIFMYLGFGSSLSIFLYHGTLSGIPKSLDEAATIDGCNKFQVFWYVIFPVLKPITVTVAILNTIWIWNDYLLPSLVINQEGMQTIPLRMFFFFGEYTKQWHLALAGLTIAIIPVIIGYFIAQREIIKGISEGAVK